MVRSIPLMIVTRLGGGRMNRPSENPFGGPPPGVEDFKRMVQKGSGWLKVLLLLIILVVISTSCWFQVEPDEVAVMTLFGKYVDTKEPGLHFKIPIAHQVIKIEAKRQLKAEFGFRTEAASIKSEFRRDVETRKESTMLTGDLNVAVVEWIVHYKISDPKQYVFKVRNVTDTLRALSESTMRSVVGDYSVTEVLTRGREEILDKARQQLADLCENYETGITIQRIELKDSAPPDPVKPSFNEVNQAEQERDRLENEAWAKYNSEIPKAHGEAKQIIQQARGYASERENNAKGDAERFLDVEAQYARAPEVTRTRMYLETMTEVIPKAGKKTIVDDKVKGVLPLLMGQDDLRTGGVQ
jgi:membrane protease subunit HflK